MNKQEKEQIRKEYEEFKLEHQDWKNFVKIQNRLRIGLGILVILFSIVIITLKYFNLM